MGEMIIYLIAAVILFGITWFSDYEDKQRARYYEQKMTEAYVKGDTAMGDTYNGILSRMKARNRFL